MTETRLEVSFLWFFVFRRKGGLYAENEQETETRVGIVSERKKSHYLQRTLQKIQQGELFNYMTERRLKSFQRGKYGSTALHLTSLQYQIKQDSPDLFIGVDLAIIHK